MDRRSSACDSYRTSGAPAARIGCICFRNVSQAPVKNLATSEGRQPGATLLHTFGTSIAFVNGEIVENDNIALETACGPRRRAHRHAAVH